MNDNEIIKALECCTSHEYSSCKSKNCPCYGLCGKDIDALEKACLDLINRLKAQNKEFDENLVIYKGTIDWQAKEINRLKTEAKQNENIIRLADKTIETQNAEIESLKKDIYIVKDGVLELLPRTDIEEIKSEARKEFAEELKTRIKNAVFCCYDLRFKNHLHELLKIIVAKIDNLVKEMEGEGNV